ncbi:MAG: hypothetical protein Q4C70_10165 [Planctomycetia bacterium]|nr:hypothetical protein [Planctomycetia bacterium]
MLLTLILMGCEADFVTTEMTQDFGIASEDGNAVIYDESISYSDCNRITTIKEISYNISAFAWLEPMKHIFVIISKPEIKIFPIEASIGSRTKKVEHPEYFGKDGQWHGTQCEYRNGRTSLGKFSPENRFLYVVSLEGIESQISFADAGIDGDLIFSYSESEIRADRKKAKRYYKNILMFNAQIEKFIEMNPINSF